MEKLAAVSPFRTRPTNSHCSVGAKAMNRKSTARPKLEISRIGRRPNRSDIIPRIGPTMNCIAPQVVPKTTFQSEAAAVSPPAS